MGFCVLAASAGAGLAVAFPLFPVLCLSALMTGGATGVASISLQRHVGRSAQSNTELKRMFSWLVDWPGDVQLCRAADGRSAD